MQRRTTVNHVKAADVVTVIVEQQLELHCGVTAEERHRGDRGGLVNTRFEEGVLLHHCYEGVAESPHRCSTAVARSATSSPNRNDLVSRIRVCCKVALASRKAFLAPRQA